MPTGYPPRAECMQCGLYSKCCNPWVHPRVDGRQHLEGQDLSQRPMVLFVLPHALMGDDTAEKALHDERTKWMMTYLDQSTFRWAVTYLVKCWPGPDPKNRAKDRNLLVANTRTCSQFLIEDYQRFQPSIVVAMGSEPLKALWPADRGDAPSINKARTTPVKLANGMWLVSTFDPKSHFYYLTSEGRLGNDLTEEYLRVWRLCEQLLAGTYQNRSIEYSVITNQQEFELMLRRLKPNDECPLYLDTETTTWIMDSNEKKPWKWDLHCEQSGLPYEPQKLTRWHPDSGLLVLGITQYWPGGYHSFEILPHLLTSDIPGVINPNADRLLRGRTIEFWNGKGDAQDIRIFSGGYNIFEPELNGNTWEDGMLRHGLRDMSLPGNGLKKVAVELAGAEDWSIQMGQALSEAKHARVKRKEPALVHMGDVPIEITLPYNAGDHYWNAVVVEEHQLAPENQAALDAINTRYQMLIDCYPWLAEMEWNGVPYRLDKLDARIQEYEAEVARIEATVRAQPEVIRAERRSGKEFNLNSPIFFEALVAELMGHLDPNGVLQVPTDFPRTESGRLSQDKFVVAELAGEKLSGAGVQIQFTTWEEKTPLQKFWSVLRRWKRTGDDLTKFRGLMDYVIPDPHDPTRGTIHMDFRVIRMETEDADSSDEESGGARSGRTCVAKGTFVECPRDISKYPHGIPIEDIRPGQMVYSYNDGGELSLRPVLWAGQTGVLPTVTIQWRKTGRRSQMGHVTLTADHRVRLLDGSWKEAGKLQPKDRVMALSRGRSCGYGRLYARHSKDLREHDFIAQQLWGVVASPQLHIHHKDKNKLNNEITNLEVLRPVEHMKHHVDERNVNRSYASGQDHYYYRAVPRFQLLRMLASCGGGPKKTAVKYGLDYSTVVSRAKEHSIPISEVAKRYNGNGVYLSAGRVKAALEQARTANDVAKLLGVNYYRAKELAEFYGFTPRNHEVIAVLPGPVVPVYDLEVEETHCFIANEIAVHNSQTPNQQNVKKEKEFLELEEAPPGWLLLHFDFDRSELVWVGFNCNDELYRDWAKQGLDAHLLNGANIFHFQTGRSIDDFWAYRSYEECMALDKCADEQKPWRDIGKTDNFAVVFLKEPETVAAELKLPVETVIEMFEASRAAHQGVYHKLLEIYDRLQRNEMIRTSWGGQRSGRGWQYSSMSAETFFSLDPEIRKRRNRNNMDIFRSIWNTAVGQGDSNDTTMHKGSRMWRRVREGGWLDRDKLRPYNFVHDSTKWLVREGYELVAAPELRREMMDMSTLPFAFDLPLGVSVEIGKDGSAMEKLKL